MQRSDYEKQLKHSEESLEFALQSGRMGTWDINLETKVITCSREMLDLWGVKDEEFTGQRSPLQQKVHPDDVEMMKAAVDSAILNNTIYELEYRIIPAPGIERWVMSRGRCSFSPDSKLPTRFSGVVFDITDRKAREAVLSEAIRIRDQFFMIASHELRTPLTSLSLQIQVAEWELQNLFPEAFTAERLQAGLKKQKEQLLRITRIVDNILDETKISQNKLHLQYEEFDLGDMVKDVLGRFRVMADAHGVQILYTPVQGVFGEWDRFRLEQVLLNLLMNAIRYGNKKPVTIGVTKNENQVFLSICDQGIGIKQEDQDRVFNRFERAVTDNMISGMGLGLFISKNIVSAHGGEIKIKSEINCGSDFTVALPKLRPKP